MTTDQAIRNSIKAGAPGLSDLIVDAIVRSAMLKIHHDAGVALSEENDRLIDEKKDAIWRLHSRIDARLNNHLCEMKEGYDDSIVGFNEAWDIMRAVFADAEGVQP